MPDAAPASHARDAARATVSAAPVAFSTDAALPPATGQPSSLLSPAAPILLPAAPTVAGAAPAQHAAQAAGLAADVAAAPAQLAQALTSLHIRPDGSSQLTVSLHPAELGQVEIRITRGIDGGASVQIATDRLQTLHALQADVSHLHTALDRAGIPEQRSLTMHLSSPSTNASEPQMSAGGFEGGNPNHSPGGGRDRGAWQPPDVGLAGPDFGAAPAPAERTALATRHAAGVNITA